MRFLVSMFLLVTLVSCILALPHHTDSTDQQNGIDEHTHTHEHGTGEHTHTHEHGTGEHTHTHEHGTGEHTHTHEHGTGEHTHTHEHGTGEHTHTHEHSHKHSHSKSSEESKASMESHESGEAACTGAHEVMGCAKKEAVCGGVQGEVKCSRKCICMKGYSRKGAECVPSEQCGDKKVRREVTDCSDPKEVYLYCGSACPARCGEKPGAKGACTTECVRGCFCKKGFVLNSHNKCVSPDKC